MAVFMYRVLTVFTSVPYRWLRQNEVDEILVSVDGHPVNKPTLHRALTRLVGADFLRSRDIVYEGRKVKAYQLGSAYTEVAQKAEVFVSLTPKPATPRRPDLMEFRWPAS